jgi:hybrid cluster-associated redox disulfide protein
MSDNIITAEMTIGEVMETHPATEEVFKKFFGNGCFTCPGAKTEDIGFGCTMHGVDPDEIIKELNEAVAKAAN